MSGLPALHGKKFLDFSLNFPGVTITFSFGQENMILEPDGTEVELASTFRVIVLRTAKMEQSHNNY